MQIYGVISEYNPFHKGHRYMLAQMRQSGATHIVVCMSGNITQRGDFAVFDKYTRTRCALLNGADLVIELPVTYACAGAERFASGGVFLLNAVGCVQKLCFGSESGSIDDLTAVSQAIKSDNYHTCIQQHLANGMTFAAARQKAVFEQIGALADLLREPNNILAVEYIKALTKIHSPITPCTITRTGASHDSNVPVDHIASASHIREQIYQGNSYDRWIPENTRVLCQSVKNPPDGSRFKKMELAFLYRLRTMNQNDFALLPDMSEGLENRIYRAVRKAVSVEEVLTLAKCKRYTMSRIRRAVLHALLGITQNTYGPLPQYIRVLGFNRNGRDILRLMRQTAALPVIMKSADISHCSNDAKEMFSLECRCDDIYALSGKITGNCGQNFTENIIIL